MLLKGCKESVLYNIFNSGERLIHGCAVNKSFEEAPNHSRSISTINGPDFNVLSFEMFYGDMGKFLVTPM